MYPSSALLGNHKDPALANIPVEDLIEQADGFAGVFPGYYLLFFYYVNAKVVGYLRS